jgi:hypothetical protein
MAVAESSNVVVTLIGAVFEDIDIPVGWNNMPETAKNNDSIRNTRPIYLCAVGKRLLSDVENCRGDINSHMRAHGK